jgi:hypothetical protein
MRVFGAVVSMLGLAVGVGCGGVNTGLGSNGGAGGEQGGAGGGGSAAADGAILGGDAGGAAGSGTADGAVDAPSCRGLAPSCGRRGKEDCCASPLVSGGTFYRSYDGVTALQYVDYKPRFRSIPSSIASATS